MFGPLVENIAMVHCLMAAELDNGYDGLDDAVWPLQGKFKRPGGQTMGTSCKDTVPSEDLMYKRLVFRKEI